MVLTATPSGAQPSPEQTCRSCHNRPANPAAAGPPSELLKKSVHATLECESCHASISLEALDPSLANPHGETVDVVNCGECHEDEAELYVRHGRLSAESHKDVPRCWSCHGDHDILPSSNRASHTHPLNIAKTCKSCHTNTDVIKDHDILRDEPIRLYDGSVHGAATRRGLAMAASCNDCHSASGPDGAPSAHRILDPGEPSSPIHHFNIPDTCGRCHQTIADDYWAGIHGQLVKRGVVAAPVCTRCHGEHGILSPSDMRSPVSAARLAEATCAPCHESEVLNERFGVPPGRLRSYVDSYHGLKRKAGNVHVANCASCHGDHLILPHTNPASSIHPDNLQKTCGQCHPGISALLANEPIHATATGIRTGWPRFFTVFYLWLIGLTIGAMLLHNLGHWFRHVRHMTAARYVIRMTANETLQHWILMISFIVLVISGFALRFSEAWWVNLLFGWGGGEGFIIRGRLHRIAAVVFTFWALWHLIYLVFTRRGRHYFRDMLADWEDVRHIKQNALYFLSRRDEGPLFRRFSYVEKCEYWALLWGTVIMSVTGVLLWFDNFFVDALNLPKGVLDVALVIHYYEAWLATLAILVWHMYSTVFSPSVYPMNPAWWAGKMPKKMYDHEHPKGPNLKARQQRSHFEEELETEPPPDVDPSGQI